LSPAFLPTPEGLLVKLSDYASSLTTLLNLIPTLFLNQPSFPGSGSCLGPALLIAQKLLAPVGGRITIFSHSLPTLGPGALPSRGSKPTGTAAPNLANLTKELNPAIDFYKKIALDCSGGYIAVDIFFTGGDSYGYQDVASVSCVSRFSGGCVYRIGVGKLGGKALLESCFLRYLTRKIGFEAVMRVRCSR
jgi:protein transport protein SEC24